MGQSTLTTAHNSENIVKKHRDLSQAMAAQQG